MKWIVTFPAQSNPTHPPRRSSSSPPLVDNIPRPLQRLLPPLPLFSSFPHSTHSIPTSLPLLNSQSSVDSDSFSAFSASRLSHASEPFDFRREPFQIRRMPSVEREQTSSVPSGCVSRLRGSWFLSYVSPGMCLRATRLPTRMEYATTTCSVPGQTHCWIEQNSIDLCFIDSSVCASEAFYWT